MAARSAPTSLSVTPRATTCPCSAGTPLATAGVSTRTAQWSRAPPCAAAPTVREVKVDSKTFDPNVHLKLFMQGCHEWWKKTESPLLLLLFCVHFRHLSSSHDVCTQGDAEDHQRWWWGHKINYFSGLKDYNILKRFNILLLMLHIITCVSSFFPDKWSKWSKLWSSSDRHKHNYFELTADSHSVKELTADQSLMYSLWFKPFHWLHQINSGLLQ